MCDVCAGGSGVSEMTDGKTHHNICDNCRSLVVTFFHVYRSMEQAVSEARQAYRGGEV